MTASKHIVLDPYRVRNCEPNANHRPPINQASRCWYDDWESACNRQQSYCCAPSRFFVSFHDTGRRSPDIELRMERATKASALSLERDSSGSWSPQLQSLSGRSPVYQPDSGPANTDVERSVDPFGMVCASGRNALFFRLFKPFRFEVHPREIFLDDGFDLLGRRPSTSFPMGSTGSQGRLRTHSFLRVSYEKRNADECPPTGGKSNCHR